MTRSVPPHGTTARRGRGCTCGACMTAAHRYDKHLRAEHTRGLRRTVPAAEATEHLQALLDAGMAWTAIADRTGVSMGTLSAVRSGRPTANRRTVEAILAANAAPSRWRMVDATGTVRRIRALMAIGWDCKTIARTAGVNVRNLSDVLRGCSPLVRQLTVEAVERAYRELASHSGPSVRARNWAARRGWPSPAAWDAIDDPQAQPVGVRPEGAAA